VSDLKEKARQLGIRSVVSNWDYYADKEWLAPLLLAEEQERANRAFERRIREARIGQFKPMSDFDWQWPQKIDREHIEDLFSLQFLREKSNVILVGTNGLGKTMIAQNLAHSALMKGITTKFSKASDMLNELVECDGSAARRRCLRKYCNVPLLVLDEVGYLSYDNRFADLLYEVISGRYERHSTVVTTNKSFKQWKEIFPHAACAVTLVDRLMHKSESILIEGESFRAKEAAERGLAKAKVRQQSRKGRKATA
jgi:DNA replication protein DnaC